MNRLHLHISVKDIQESIDFYSSIFGEKPSVKKEDYAKWQLDNPLVNFAISNRSDTVGLDHLGIQVDSDSELALIARRLKQAKIKTSEQHNTACCYARSNKYWAVDPQGIAWESFQSLENIPIYGDEKTNATNGSSACCIPSTPTSLF